MGPTMGLMEDLSGMMRSHNHPAGSDELPGWPEPPYRQVDRPPVTQTRG